MSKPITTLNDYTKTLSAALASVSTESVQEFNNAIYWNAKYGRRIFVCGNGGSAAIAEHLTCDCMKGISMDTSISPDIVSLASNFPLISAIANDISYDEIFAKQLEWQGRYGEDLLIVISSSGNSPNILSALNTASRMGIKSVSITGFDGGKAKELADVAIHIKSNNYGIIEDATQAIMHFVAQSIRRECATGNPEDIKY